MRYRAYGADFLSDTPLESLDVVTDHHEPVPALVLQACQAEELESPRLQHEFSLNPMHERELRVRYAHLPGVGQDLPEKNLELEVVGLIRFRISSPGRLNYAACDQCEPWQIEFWFLHVFLPVYLSLFRSGQFFHGAAVEQGGVVQAFVGPTRSGKSTLTEAMLARGYRLFADDKFRVSNRGGVFYVHPSHGRFRPYRKSEDLGLVAEYRGLSAMPLGNVFVLEDSNEYLKPEIAKLAGSAGIALLTDHLLYQFYLSRAQGLLTATGFAQAGLIHRLSRPWGLSHLEETAEYLDSWLQQK